MAISTDLAISNSMSSFVPKYWLNWQILVADEFRRQRWNHQSVHNCAPLKDTSDTHNPTYCGAGFLGLWCGNKHTTVSSRAN